MKLSLTRRYKVRATGRYYLVDLLTGSTPPTMVLSLSTPDWSAGTSCQTASPAESGAAAPARFPSTLKNTGTDETRCILGG